jgi:hypothetical protein
MNRHFLSFFMINPNPIHSAAGLPLVRVQDPTPWKMNSTPIAG